jgi:ubiquitin carboxyl-terminal hydrolase 14
VPQSLKEEITKRSDKLGRDAKWMKLSRISRLPYIVTVQFVRFFWGQTSSVVNKESIAKKIVRVRLRLVYTSHFCSAVEEL